MRTQSSSAASTVEQKNEIHGQGFRANSPTTVLFNFFLSFQIFVAEIRNVGEREQRGEGTCHPLPTLASTAHQYTCRAVGAHPEQQ